LVAFAQGQDFALSIEQENELAALVPLALRQRPKAGITRHAVDLLLTLKTRHSVCRGHLVLLEDNGAKKFF
jgi:hypothetical protein